jgi:hypothetical protein
MAKKPPRPWTVTPHDPIVKVDDNLWTVESAVPGLPVRRRMFIVKLTDGSLLFYHAVPLEDRALEEVKAWGRPAIFLAAHSQHIIDGPAFVEKLGLKVYGPKQDEVELQQRVPLAGTLDDLPKDPSFSVEATVGTKHGEPILVVRSGDRVSLCFSDAIQNNPPEKSSFFIRLMGFTGGPKVVPLFRFMFLKDKKALRGQLERLAETPGLARLLPCHGSPVVEDAAGKLRAAAASL